MSSNYSDDERYKIIRYILDNELLSGLKGNELWKDIEKAKIINRSWHSMRKQFHFKIINTLHVFNLTDEERMRILHRFDKGMKTDTSDIQNSIVEKFSQLSFKTDSDSDTVKHLTDENNKLKTTSDSEDQTSPDLLCNAMVSCSLEESEQLLLGISEMPAERDRTKKASTGKITVHNKATQLSDPAFPYTNKESGLYKAGKYLQFVDNNVNYMFVPDIIVDHSAERKEIHDQFIIADENIHFVDTKFFIQMSIYCDADDKFHSSCDEFVKTGEFNHLYMGSLVDQMKLVLRNFTGTDFDVNGVESETQT